jgi:AcrR family transcriptional regulator
VGRGKKIDDMAVVVDAAIGLIEKDGIEEFSTRRLAAALKISAMTLYNYFSDREDILKEVAIRCMEDFNRLLDSKLAASPESARETGGNPIRSFKILARNLLAFGMAQPRLYLFLFDSSLGAVRDDPKFSVQYDHLARAAAALMADPDVAGAFRKDVLLFELLANSLVIGSIRWPGNIDEATANSLVDRAYELLLSRYEAAAIQSST